MRQLRSDNFRLFVVTLSLVFTAAHLSVTASGQDKPAAAPATTDAAAATDAATATDAAAATDAATTTDAAAATDNAADSALVGDMKLTDQTPGNAGAEEEDPPAVSESSDRKFESGVAAAANRNSTSIFGKTISLDEALRITLLKQPTVLLAGEDIKLAEAALQAAVAPFDWVVTFDVEHGRQYNPLPDTQINLQREAKRNLEKISREVKALGEGRGDGLVEITETNPATGDQRLKTIDISNLANAGFNIDGIPSGIPSTGSLAQAQNNQQFANQFADQAAFLNQTLGSIEQNFARTNQQFSLDAARATLSQQETAARSFAGAEGERLQDLEGVRQRTIRLLDRNLDRALRDFNITTTAQSSTTSYSLGASKLLENGVIMTPHVDWQRQGINNTASINLDFNIPLLADRGGVMERASLDAAKIDLDASRWQLRHELSLALLNTAMAYWNLQAAQQDHALLAQSESVSQSFADLTDLRVEEEDISIGEAAQAQARLADIVGQRYAAEFAILNARQQLGLAMGLEAGELIDPPYAKGLLPPPVNINDLSSTPPSVILQRAFTLRDDRRSAIQLARSGKLLSDAAKFNIKPIVDLFFNFSYVGVDEGTQSERLVSAFADNKVGLGATGGISLVWPLQLNAARAEHRRSAALYRQRRISAEDAHRAVGSGVALAVGSAVSTGKQLQAADRSIGYSRQALETARALYNEGENSLLDSIQLEQQFTGSLRNRIAVQLNHVIAVTRLRFETGTLLTPSTNFTSNSVTFQATELSRIPDWNSLPDAPLRPIRTSFDERPQPLLSKIGFGGDDDSDRGGVIVEERIPAAPGVVPPAPVTASDVDAPTPPPVPVVTAESGGGTVADAEATAEVNPPAAPREKSKPLLKRLFGR